MSIETLIDFAIEYAGLIVVLLSLFAIFRKRQARGKKESREAGLGRQLPLSAPIEPGDDTTKLSEQMTHQHGSR